jgi:mxaA protein
MRTWLILAILLLGYSPGLAAVDAVDVYEPRAFGHFLGDTFERRVRVVTSGDTELLASGLPRPGPLTYWLDLIAVTDKVSEADGKKIHDIALKYQTFYSALQPTKVTIPAYPLKFRNPGLPKPSEAPEGEAPGETAEDIASIPAFPIVMSPLREFAVSDFMSGKGVEVADVMRPDAVTKPLGTSRQAARLGLAVAALALSILLLLWHYAKGPFARRPGRPFTRAERRIRELQSKESGDELYRESLIILHRALDESFGRRVFASDLQAFLKQRRGFATLKDTLQQFFEGSRIFFFSGNKAAAESKFPIDDVRRLAAELAREEKAA